MAATTPDRRSRVLDALGFWFITLVICAVAGFGSYRFGRQWIGDRLGTGVKTVLTTDELASRVGEEALLGGGASDEAVPEEPPKEAVVEVTATQVSSEDRQRLRLEQQRRDRDDGSRAAGADDDGGGDAEEGEPATESRETRTSASSRPTPEEPAAASTGDREFLVRAGSFTRSENAERVVAELRARGYQPFVTRTVKDGVEYQRVNVARYDDREKALDLRRELQEEGYSADIATE